MDPPPSKPNELRLAAYVVAGVLLGAIYVAFDVVSEARIGTGTLTGAAARVHTVVDRGFPLLVGALLGVGAHYLRLRAQLTRAEEAASRAEALRERLQKVERDQAVWVLAAAVLHEVNNPLHALGLLLDELGATEDAAARADLLGRARAQSERALSHLRLLRSLRGADEPEFEDVALDRVVGALAEDVGRLASEDGLVVRVECPVPVHASADPRYVRTIVENLVDNSLQSLRERGKGCIVVRIDREDDRAVVRVSDDGPSLDGAALRALFEPLSSTKAHGLGLGLPIARALARAMRGELTLDDAGGKTFRLELPAGGSG